MDLKVQKRIAASVLKCSQKRVAFNNDRLDEIKESITRDDIRGLVTGGAIICLPKQGVSRVRANKRLVQYRKGRRKNEGSQKGKHTARLPTKQTWMNHVRLQRLFIAALKEKGSIDVATSRKVYRMIKGGFFRNKRHVKLYLEENKLFTKAKQ